MREGIRIGNKSSLRVFESNQERYARQSRSEPKYNPYGNSGTESNPYDVNLLDKKETILFSKTLHKFNFDDKPYIERHVVITRNALRIYENQQQALSTYGKPIIAIPWNAVETIQRTMFDANDDTRIDSATPSQRQLFKSMLEFTLKDDFLPIYTHS